MAYWLLKSEPSTFGIEHLAAAKDRTTSWTGVRNFQARNFIRDAVRIGDQAFFYHSSCPEPAIVGIVKVTRAAYPDPTAFDARDVHFDPASKREAPRWFTFDVRLQRTLRAPITLENLRRHARTQLRDLLLLRRGNRLSITPVSDAQWQFIVAL